MVGGNHVDKRRVVTAPAAFWRGVDDWASGNGLERSEAVLILCRAGVVCLKNLLRLPPGIVRELVQYKHRKGL